jgi:hypothetical protein
MDGTGSVQVRRVGALQTFGCHCSCMAGCTALASHRGSSS